MLSAGRAAQPAERGALYRLLTCGCGGKPAPPPSTLQQLGAAFDRGTDSCCSSRAVLAVLLVTLLAAGGAGLAWCGLGRPRLVLGGGSSGGGSSAPTLRSVAATALSEDHPMGATTLNVKETSGFSKGDRISISSGGVSEQKRIVDLGSIILDQPLEHDFPKGAKVSKLRGEAASAKDDEVGVEEEEAPSDVDPNNYGPKPITFYVYRASGDVHYPLENVNVGDLAGVMWYLHNEIVPAPVRKYGIDRIRRYKVRMRPVVEFWNVHHTYFGPFMAYDAAKCTTPMGKQVYDQYGYILGCQPVTPGRSAYEADEETLTPEACSAPDLGCRSPVWYSLPGACPLKKLRPTDVEYTQKIHGVTEKLGHTLIASSDDDAKSDTCIASEPGGRCDNPTGAPDCAYSVEDAGEVLLDELVGIKPNFNDWFQNITVTREYDEKTDKGIGVSFWDGRQDKDKCQARLHSAQVMFEQKFGRDNDLTEGQPVCDFDSWYDQEFTWKRNHTGAMKPTRGFSWESHATV